MDDKIGEYLAGMFLRLSLYPGPHNSGRLIWSFGRKVFGRDVHVSKCSCFVFAKPPSEKPSISLGLITPSVIMEVQKLVLVHLY